VLLTYNEPVDRSFFRLTIDGDSGSALAGQPVFQDDRTVAALLRPNAAGVLVVSWLAVGSDAHPVTGQYYFAISTPGRTGLAADLNLAATRVGSFESGAGKAGLTGVIEAGRSIEIILLYLVIGVVLLGVLVPRPRLALISGREPVSRWACRQLLAAGALSVVLMPVLFWLSADRLTELIPGLGVSRVLMSSIGAQWAVKTALWLALVGLVGVILRRPLAERSTGRRLGIGIVALAIALAGAFVAGTHVGTGSVGPEWLYIPMMAAHILLTAFWAGGLLALLLVVFPSHDPAEIWAAAGRFSRIMTVSAGILVTTGILLLVKLLANFKSLWCTTYGLVAGFKVSVVVLALVFGVVNNRLVAAHRRAEELPAAARRGRRAGPTILTLRRLVTMEAALLLGVLVLAAVLGETQLPPLFSGRALPGETQVFVQPGLLGSGCE
jgi:putative copper export protein